ncbi:MAG: homoserine O-succinyltransferase [Gammaproteobacteria bacterium]|nr:homoserine O-succinyltransferase [Gammaproteobacteria bacterium]
MNILCIMHADFETPGVIEEWAMKNNHHFHLCKPYRGENCLEAADFDLLIMMGGPQSPLEIDKAPYLKDEITVIQRAIKNDKKILGFCLGAQLIGEALGAKTQKSPEKEVGVFPVFLTKAGVQDPLLQDFPSSFPVIHWHNDMPGETQHSQVLAYSEGCPRQIIKYSPKIYGFQCHMEITLEGMKTMIEACENDLQPSPFTQTAQELMTHFYNDINKMMLLILEKFIKL